MSGGEGATRKADVDGKATFLALQKLAKATKKDPQKVAMRYLLERLAGRIFSSEHAERFVLKGGMLMMLAEDASPLDGRGTSDLDIQAPGFGGTIDDFRSAMEEILSGEADGVSFDTGAMKVTAVREGRVPGGSLTVPARLGTLRLKMKCDVTFDARSHEGDMVAETFPSVLPGGEGVSVRRIPFEHVVADKLQALVRHGPVNYRMRDYYDLFVILTRGKAPDALLVAENLRRTFDLFGSDLPQSAGDVPALQDAHAVRREPMWRAELKARDFWIETPSFPEMVREIRERSAPLFDLALRGSPSP